ncbi:MAG: glycosyltransferase family 4 protein [Lachnospiraceae bacterium]
MKITFITNYLTHHQLPFAEEMYHRLGKEFCFIATDRMDEERIRMGWELDDRQYPYVLFCDDAMQQCERLVMDSDIVICGGTHELYIRKRLAAGKITFRYFERLYKKGQWRAFSPRGYLKNRREHTANKDKPVYLLCAGAYVPSDFHLLGAYPEKMLKWGYFPMFRPYDTEQLMNCKSDVCRILWTGRMIHWKHAEDAVGAIERLLQKNPQREDFHLTMVGEGECAPKVREMIEHKTIAGRKLSELITMQSFIKPQEVRSLMEQSSIYLMTSDYEEGWGAVVNEAMNSGCAVIASHSAGSVPYLIRHGENGLVYKSGHVKELAGQIEELLESPLKRKQLGEAAYHTIADTWNPAVAAERMLCFCEALLQGNYQPEKEGPLSSAELIAPGKGYRYCHR